MVFIGFGMGICFLTTILAAQNSVDLPRMGVSTGLVNFTRQLGGALGVAIAGAVMLTSLTSRLADLFPGQHIPAGALLSAQTAKSFPAETQDAVRGAFADSLHLVFVTMFVIAVVGAFTMLLMPRGKPVVDQVPEIDGHPWTRRSCPTARRSPIMSPIDGPTGPRRPTRSSRLRGHRLAEVALEEGDGVGERVVADAPPWRTPGKTISWCFTCAACERVGHPGRLVRRHELRFGVREQHRRVGLVDVRDRRRRRFLGEASGVGGRAAEEVVHAVVPITEL